MGEGFGGGRWPQGFGADQVVGVAVAGGDDVDVGAVGGAGERGVEVASGHALGDDGVRGAPLVPGLADGQALDGGGGGGVAEADVPGSEVPGGQGPGDAAVELRHGDRTVGVDVADPPAVVVADEVGAAQGQGAGVAFGDDQVPGGEGLPARQVEFPTGRSAGGGDPVGPGAGVEFGDLFQRGGDHDRIGAGWMSAAQAA